MNLENGAKNETISIRHNSKIFSEVLKEFLSKFPEESFYFLNEGELVKNYEEFEKSFLPNKKRNIAYAVKANPIAVEILARHGMSSFDCSSQWEVDHVLQHKPNAKILYTNPNPRHCDVSYAANKGVAYFVVQTKNDVAKILQNTDGIIPLDSLNIAVRLSTWNPKADINLSEKFGIGEEKALDILNQIKEAGALPGVTIHAGSQNKDPETFRFAIQKMADLIKASKEKVKSINVGGGIPANYLETDNFNIQEIIEVINESINEVVEDILEEDGVVYIEPGRSIVAEYVDLLIPVISVRKQNGDKRICIYDGRFTSFSRGDPPNAESDLKVIREIEGELVELPPQPSEIYIIDGRTCDSADVLGKRIMPAEIKPGDWIWHKAAGAYNAACYGTFFNGFPNPKWILYNPV
jgi:ornithine decarboxylase